MTLLALSHCLERANVGLRWLATRVACFLRPPRPRHISANTNTNTNSSLHSRVGRPSPRQTPTWWGAYHCEKPSDKWRQNFLALPKRISPCFPC